MVTMPARLRALDRKLLRDLWAMKGQSLAIASVIAAGVAMFVMYLSNFDSLQRTRAAYYESARFADVFASLKRAPSSLEARIAALPGVEAVATRVVADVTLDVPGMAEPAIGRLISLPDRGRPALNDVYLRRGRWVDPTRPDEVLASEIFCDAHGFNPGDRVAAIINGRRRWLTIVGIALSPEYVYAIRPGAIFPDKRQFGIFWMSRRALASAFNMEGGFNDVSIATARGANAADVIAGLDRLLEPYGGFGAIAAVRADLRLDARQRAATAADLRLHHAGHLPRRRGLHPERRADARVVAAAPADRRAQGARLLESGAGLALHQVGARDRRIRRAGRRRGRRLARLGHDWPLQRVLPVPGPRLPSLGRRRRPVGDRQPRGRGGGRAVGGAARGAHSAGRSDASGDAGPVSSQCRRARVAARPHHAGDADDSAQSRTSARSDRRRR